MSESFYAEFIQGLPVAVFRTTLEGRLLFGNRALARMLGLETFSELRHYPVFELYSDNEDRTALFEAVAKTGRVEGHRIFLVRKDGRPVCCHVTAKGVFDGEGRLTCLDGVLREIIRESPEGEEKVGAKAMVNAITDFIILLGEKGEILNINRAGAELLEFRRDDLIGRSIFDFVLPLYKELFSMLLTIVTQTGREEGVLTVMNRKGVDFHLEFLATLIENKGELNPIQIIARDVTRRIKKQKKRLNEEKFSGVIEMAGGVAHRLNQPLTIIGNTVQEVLSHLEKDHENYPKMMRIREQLGRLNEITKKIGRIRKYEAMDYVAGVKIVDIDKAS